MFLSLLVIEKRRRSRARFCPLQFFSLLVPAERNKSNHGEKRASPDELYSRFLKFVSEWNEFCKPKNNQCAKPIQKWIPPPDDFIKINLDGTFSSVTHNGGWGCIARSSDGSAIFAAAGPTSNLTDALQSECNAMLKAISFAEQYGMGKVIFATDCSCLKLAISSDEYDCAPLGTLFREIKFLLRMGFIEYRIEYCPRLCNKPAHVLASIGAQEVEDDHTLWLTDLPDDVSHTVVDNIVASTI
jgi:hypothetical protein